MDEVWLSVIHCGRYSPLKDIDIDICPSKRPLILNKIKEERALGFAPHIDDLSRQHLGCTLIATFGTETTKATILSACRGYRSEDFPDGIDVDTAQYISSLIEQERGFLFTLEDTIYGNKDKNRKPNQLFIKEVSNYPGLLDIMFGINNLVNKRSSHASGVILFDEDPYEFGCFMRSPSGDVITQWDLHDCEYAGMTKFDILVTENQDKIVQTIGQLQRNKVIPPELSLKEVYNQYLHPEVMNIKNQKIWEEIGNCHILDLFQFDSPQGQQAARKIRPDNMFELACANGLIRLVAMEQGAETPMDKYVRFKKDINEWYTEMSYYGLSKEEQSLLEKYMLEYKGMCFSQEQLMLIAMDPDICGFTLGEANALRKVVGKKIISKIPEMREKIFAQAKTQNMAKYVWEQCIGPQMSYSFSIIHSVAYSFIGYQNALLATLFDSIYWNTACLIVNSGAIDPEKKASTDYGKIAKAIGDIRSSGIKVSLADINKSEYGFIPDVDNNEILFGLKGLQNVGDDVVKVIIENRPYVSFEDFITRVNPNKQTVLSLIKGGAFDKFEDRRRLMVKYIYRTSDLKRRLTLQNFNGLVQNELIPQELNFEKSIYYFTKYLKAACKASNDRYLLDANAQKFYFEHFDTVTIEDGNYYISIKEWDKTYKKIMDKVRDWLSVNQETVLKTLNEKLFFDNWNKYCGNGNISAWEMEALCFYYHEHELAHINMEKYGISHFVDLPTEPEVDYYFHRKNANIPIYKIDKIVGTCIAKNKNKSNISLLTADGVVTVKFRKEYFALFDKQISQLQENGKKKVIEKSWFKRGNMLMIQGIRRDDNFIAKKYAKTPGHQLYKIISIDDNGDIVLQGERNQGDYEESED
jgi:DNA polymerase-3 subunit alpha